MEFHTGLYVMRYATYAVARSLHIMRPGLRISHGNAIQLDFSPQKPQTPRICQLASMAGMRMFDVR